MSENPYSEAARVECPKCGAERGDPCRERYCKNGYRDCPYAVCSRIRDLDAPHAARLARAALAAPDSSRAALDRTGKV